MIIFYGFKKLMHTNGYPQIQIINYVTVKSSQNRDFCIHQTPVAIYFERLSATMTFIFYFYAKFHLLGLHKYASKRFFTKNRFNVQKLVCINCHFFKKLFIFCDYTSQSPS